LISDKIEVLSEPETAVVMVTEPREEEVAAPVAAAAEGVAAAPAEGEAAPAAETKTE
jgi:hypothetical protein